MTVEERIANMEKKIERDNEKERLKKLAIENKKKKWLSMLPEYSSRIRDIIELGCFCKARNVAFPNGNSLRNDFDTDGIRHNFGFIGKRIRNGSLSIVGLGWKAGGACGKWDLYCDGNDIWYQNEDDADVRARDISSRDLERFFEDFLVFESNFLSWFDKECAK